MKWNSAEVSAPLLTERQQIRSPFRFVLLLGLLDAFGPLGIDMYLPAFPQMQSDLNASPGGIQLTLAVFLAGLAVGQLVMGPISDRSGRRGPLLFGAVAFAISSLVCALATSLEALLAARFLMGLAGSSGMVIARAVVRDTYNEQESARVYSLLMLVIGVAPILSPSLGSWLMELGRWPVIFYALGLFALICAVALVVDLPETHPPERRTRSSVGKLTGQYLRLLINFRYMGYALVGSLALGQIFAYVSSAPLYFMEIVGLSPKWFTVVFAGNAIGLIGIAQVNRYLMVRFTTHAILRGALLLNVLVCATLLLLVATNIGGFAAQMVALFLCLTTLGLILPNVTAAVMAPFPDCAGVAAALYGTLQFAIGAGTGAVIGMLENGTPGPMSWMIAACSGLALVIGMLVEWQRRVEMRVSAPESIASESISVNELA